MIPHNMTLFKSICVQYQFHRQTLPIIKIDRGQIQFRDYVSTGTEPNFICIPSFYHKFFYTYEIIYQFNDSVLLISIRYSSIFIYIHVLNIGM